MARAEMARAEMAVAARCGCHPVEAASLVAGAGIAGRPAARRASPSPATIPPWAETILPAPLA